MPVYEFTSPEGKTYEMDVPEGVTAEQAFGVLSKQLENPEMKTRLEQNVPLDTDIPRPSTKEEIAAHAAARSGETPGERALRALEQGLLSGGATDVRNVGAALSPLAGGTFAPQAAKAAQAMGEGARLVGGKVYSGLKTGRDVIARGRDELTKWAVPVGVATYLFDRLRGAPKKD